MKSTHNEVSSPRVKWKLHLSGSHVRGGAGVGSNIDVLVAVDENVDVRIGGSFMTSPMKLVLSTLDEEIHTLVRPPPFIKLPVKLLCPCVISSCRT